MQIIIKNLQRHKKIPIEPKKAKSLALKVIKSCKIKKDAKVSIYFVDNQKIQELNLRYLKKNYPTDVLSFDISTNKRQLYADIFISVDMALYNAGLFKTSLSYELYLYIIHGILHLLGYDDRTKKQQKIMRKKEQAILRTIQKT